MLSIAICDDEISSIQNLKNYIDIYLPIKNIQYTIFKFLSGEELLSSILTHNNHYDIIFLDVKMDKINGIDTAAKIREINDSNVLIVFITALKEYVFDAFNVNATNYLLKPIEQEKLHSTIDRMLAALLPIEDKYLIIHKNHEMKKICLLDILYCEVRNHRVYVYEKNAITHEYSDKINSLEKHLDNSFFRCHRSYIVNLKYVNKYVNGFAYLTSQEKIPIASRRQNDFLKALLKLQRNEVL